MPFELFSTQHNTVLLLVAVISAALYFSRRYLKKEKVNRILRNTFAFFILLQALSFQLWNITMREWSVLTSLPLHLCDVSVILSAFMLLKKNYGAFELTYIWGLGGALQALLTPNLWYPYPHFIFFLLFLSHGSIIIACLFMIFVEGFRPCSNTIKKVFIITNIYASIIALFNYITGSNYLFLCQKPGLPSLIDYLGPWPWYILSLEFVLIFMSCLYCLPFIAYDFLKRNKGDSIRESIWRRWT